ncbi:MAG TPA: DUF1697 domain-containing protein [Candidatus Polarisedimenticolia bacterium]|jgi:uncharacterized protein (DUF1697 family)|nr:DUF1697 domain-containing protein [Candidatus Polarisedimenticolia bacterium]
MPTNAKMPALKRCFERAGFGDVKTVLGSGNVVFSAPAAPMSTLERKAEAAMAKELGRTFHTIVRPQNALRRMLEADPYAAFRLPANGKRIITFLRKPHRAKLALPLGSTGRGSSPRAAARFSPSTCRTHAAPYS